MNLIIETDIGHDPDDFFAICYLVAAGVNIRTILISPGDPDQIAIAKFLCKEFGLNIPIGSSKVNREKLSSGSIHHELLKKYNYSINEKSDGLGEDILVDVVKNYSDSELFVIGPVSSIGKYLSKNPDIHFKRATMQGGFLPYSLYRPNVCLSSFEGKQSVPTFNLNGDRNAGICFLNSNIDERRMVGKNICHTVVFDKDKLSLVKNYNSRASELFMEAANMYFEKHIDKKFHDPTAACCHLHPELGTWIRGNTCKLSDGWTTQINSNGDYILADINYNMLWEKLMSWS